MKHTCEVQPSFPLAKIYTKDQRLRICVHALVNTWRPASCQWRNPRTRFDVERNTREVFRASSDKIRDQIKGQWERKLFHGAWMRWHESSALWVFLARGKPLEQKDRDGRVCALPRCTQTHKHAHMHAHSVCIRFPAECYTSSPQFTPAHRIIWPWWLDHCSFKITTFSQILLSSNAND